MVAVELTTLREAPLVELPAQVLQALNLDARLMKALTTLTSQPTESLVGSSAEPRLGRRGRSLPEL